MYTYIDGLKEKFPALFKELKWLSMLKGKPRPHYVEPLTDTGKINMLAADLSGIRSRNYP